jgi:hypothetical protein
MRILLGMWNCDVCFEGLPGRRVMVVLYWCRAEEEVVRRRGGGGGAGGMKG